MLNKNSIVATFDQHTQSAEKAIQRLKQAGFDMSRLSIIENGYQTQVGAVTKSITRSQTSLEHCEFMLIVDGTLDDVARAKAVLSTG